MRATTTSKTRTRGRLVIHKFESGNVRVANNVLSLIVPGELNAVSPSDGDEAGTPISCAEIITNECKIMYASVHKGSFVEGARDMRGFLLCKNDTNEADVEWLSNPTSASNFGEGYPIPLCYSNQGNATGKDAGHERRVAPGIHQRIRR